MRKLPLDVRARRSIEKLKIARLTIARRIVGSCFTAEFLARQADIGNYLVVRARVVALYRPLSSKDLSELRKSTALSWLYMKNEFLGHVQRAWCPAEMRLQTKYQTFGGEHYKSAWKELVSIGRHLVCELRTSTPVNALMTSPIDYWQAEGARLGAKRYDVPFLGLFRGVNLDNFTRDRLVLLSYTDPDWRTPGSFNEVLRLFLEAAQRHFSGNVRLVVKSKNLAVTRELRAVAGELARFAEIHEQVRLTFLLHTARLAIGSDSLSVLEAQSCRARTIVPYWSDAVRPSEELIFDPAAPIGAKAI